MVLGTFKGKLAKFCTTQSGGSGESGTKPRVWSEAAVEPVFANLCFELQYADRYTSRLSHKVLLS